MNFSRTPLSSLISSRLKSQRNKEINIQWPQTNHSWSTLSRYPRSFFLSTKFNKETQLQTTWGVALYPLQMLLFKYKLRIETEGAAWKLKVAAVVREILCPRAAYRRSESAGGLLKFLSFSPQKSLILLRKIKTFLNKHLSLEVENNLPSKK
jgi:hypothetical protein